MATDQHRHGDRPGGPISPTYERIGTSTATSGPIPAPRALRRRLLVEAMGTPEEYQAENKRITEIMAQVDMALDEARDKRSRPDSETPLELAILMVSAMHIIRGIRIISLCLNGDIKYKLYKIFNQARQEVRDAIKISNDEAGKNLRCKVERMHLARFPQEEAARLTALIHLSKEVVDTKDMAIWDTASAAMPAVLFGVQVLVPKDNMAAISIRGHTLPGSQPAQGSSPRDMSEAAATGQGATGQPATDQGGGQWASHRGTTWHLPCAGR